MGAKIGVLLNCGQQSQFSKVRREFDAGRVNLDPPMTCADWPVPGNLITHGNRIHGQTVTPGTSCPNPRGRSCLTCSLSKRGRIIFDELYITGKRFDLRFPKFIDKINSLKYIQRLMTQTNITNKMKYSYWTRLKMRVPLAVTTVS